MKALYIVLAVVLIAAISVGVILFMTGCTKNDNKNAELSFHSFDGGGPEYDVSVDDPSIVSFSSERKYAKANHEELTGAGYDEVFTFKGLKAGTTGMKVTGSSPITETEESFYTITVADDLTVTIEKIEDASTE